ncbi:MAG: S8/S53 family peptidase [Candidatus Njordarchaeia archaeon]
MSRLPGSIGKNIGAFLIVFFLLLTPFLTTKHQLGVSVGDSFYDGLVSSGAYVEGGDGEDVAVFDWINLKELKEKNYFFDTPMDTIVCIIDSGFGTVPWNKIEEDFGQTAAQTITYWAVHDYYNSGGEIYKYLFTYNNRSILDTMYYDRNGEAVYVNDEVGHGTSIAYLIKSLIPSARLLIIGIKMGYNDDIMVNLVNALELLEGGHIYYVDYSSQNIIRVSDQTHHFVLSISLGFKNGSVGLYNTLSDLHDDYSVEIFASVGNDHTTVVEYPAGYDFVHAVAAVYDDSELEPGMVKGNMTYFTNYGDWVDLSAPGYMVETIWWNRSMGNTVKYGLVEGTSYSAPISAAMFAVLWEAAAIIGHVTGVDVGRDVVLDAFYMALENKNDKTVPKPAIDSVMVLDYSNKFDIYNGYGCVDVFDAVNFLGFLSMKRIKPSSTYYGLEGQSFNVDVKANVTLSHNSDISSALRGKHSVKYVVERKSGGSWIRVSSGYLSRSARNGFDIWSGSISFPSSPSGTVYRVKLYISTSYNIVLSGQSTFYVKILDIPWG